MNYLNEIENNKNYLRDWPDIRNLRDLGRIPPRLYEKSSSPLLTHMRVAYGRVDWEDYVVKLDQHTINNLLAIHRESSRYQKLKEKLKPGMNVVIVDEDTTLPVTYNGMITGSASPEVLTYDDAINTSVYWFCFNLLEDYCGFSLTTVYFLLAFRLALMDGDMSDEERFDTTRIRKTWRHTYANMLSLVGKRLQTEALKVAKSRIFADFFLDDKEVEKYIASFDIED